MRRVKDPTHEPTSLKGTSQSIIRNATSGLGSRCTSNEDKNDYPSTHPRRFVYERDGLLEGLRCG